MTARQFPTIQSAPVRCLFFPDELEGFRPVAVALRLLRIELVMLTEFDAARLLIGALGCDAVIVGANTIDSPALTLLRLCKPANMPAVGVTCLPLMRGPLFEAGADQVFLLPDQEAQLTDALKEMQKRSRH
jgi:hypothetical protein